MSSARRRFRRAIRAPGGEAGLLPAYGGTQLLARIVGEGRALAVMLAGESISAGEALRIGLVNSVVELSESLSAAETLARSVTENAPLAIRACLEAVARGQRLPLEEGLKLEAELFSRLFATEDMCEGTRAFLEKRTPVFRGK